MIDKTSGSVIEVTELTKTYGDEKAVDSLSFTIHPHRVTGFLGPNGAGKTTTLRSILGLITPTSGSARVAGRHYSELEDPAGTVGALLETQQFHPQRTARNHLRILAAASGRDPGRVDEVLDEVGLTAAATKKVGAFSLGMKQRLGLAAALLGDPEILILDEPANGLDPSGMRWLRDLLRSYADRGRTVLVSSHLLGEVAQMVDEVVVINRGRLVSQAPVHDLVARAAGGVRVSTSEPSSLAAALSAAGVETERISATELVARTDAETIWSIAVTSGVPVTALQEEQRSLEDVFFELTRTEVEV